MAKQLKCDMPGCDFVAQGANEEEVMKKAAEHAQKAHGIQQLSPDFAAKVKGAIRDA